MLEPPPPHSINSWEGNSTNVVGVREGSAQNCAILARAPVLLYFEPLEVNTLWSVIGRRFGKRSSTYCTSCTNCLSVLGDVGFVSWKLFTGTQTPQKSAFFLSNHRWGEFPGACDAGINVRCTPQCSTNINTRTANVHEILYTALFPFGCILMLSKYCFPRQFSFR